MPFTIDDRDIKFVLYEYLKIEDLLKYTKFKDYSIEDFDMILDEAKKFAIERIAPLQPIGDQKGCRFENGKVYFPEEFHPVYKEYAEGGWIALTADPEYGGQGLPNVIGTACAEMTIGACCSFSMTPGLTHGVGNLIYSFGTEEMKKIYLEKLYSGQWAGTMCLTEPQAGSAVGDTKAMAVPVGDGKYLLSGTKNFITSGDHDLTENIIHMVLARTPNAPPGVKGLSLFLVPKINVNPDGSLGEPNDIKVGNIEHKLGIHASSTCTLIFGDNGKCNAYLVGNINEGIKLMFQMMNEARIGVGIQGEAQAAAVYEYACQYAKERIQGVAIQNMKDPNAPRVPIIEHPDIRRYLLMMKAYIYGMRGLLYRTSLSADLAEVLEDPNQREKHKAFVELLTPICKAFCSDTAFRIAEWGLQIYGGYGYCREYPMEQYLRDIKIASIYEGTNGIQALDLIGRKVGAKGGLYFLNFIMDLNSFIDRNKQHPKFANYVNAFTKAKDTLAQITMDFGQRNMKGDILYPVLYATPYLEMFGEVILGHILLEMAILADQKLEAIFASKGADTVEKRKEVINDSEDAKFYFGKIQAMKFYYANILPKVHSTASALMSNDISPLDMVF